MNRRELTESLARLKAFCDDPGRTDREARAVASACLARIVGGLRRPEPTPVGVAARQAIRKALKL